MRYGTEFWQSIRNKRLEARKNYLDSCHTKEDEVMTDYRDQEFFDVDGNKIWMPECYSDDEKYKKYLSSVI